MTSSPKSVLVADDDYDSRFLLSLLCQTYGHQVAMARDGNEAVDKAPGCDVLILDMCMPLRSGLEVAATLRQAKWTGTIVALSGDDRLRDKALAAGCDNFFVKPLEPDVLFRVIETAQRRS